MAVGVENSNHLLHTLQHSVTPVAVGHKDAQHNFEHNSAECGIILSSKHTTTPSIYTQHSCFLLVVLKLGRSSGERAWIKSRSPRTKLEA